LGVEDNDLDEEEGSLAEFEEEFLKEKKKKSGRLIFFVLLLLLLLGAGYYFASQKGLLPASLTGQADDQGETEVAPAENGDSADLQDDEIQVEDKDLSVEDEQQSVIEKIKPQRVDSRKKSKKASKKGKKVYGSRMHTFHVGVYAQKKNADHMVATLEKAGLKPETSQVNIKVEMVRVLVGHYPFREIAMKEADDLLQRGFKPRVQIVKAGEYALVMGSFQNRIDASELIASLEDKGLTVWTDKAKSDALMVPATLVKIKGVQGEMVEKVIDFLEKKDIDYLLKR